MKKLVNESEQHILQAIMNGAKNFHLVYLDRDFNFLLVNETYARNCGYHPEEMIGMNHFDLYPHPENEAIFARVRDTGVAEEYRDKPFEYSDQAARGVTYWDWTLTPVKNAAGEVTGLVFSLFETTDRKQAEEKLRESEQRFRTVAEATGAMVVDVEFATGRILVERGFHELTGYAPGEVRFTRDWWIEQLHPDDRSLFERQLQDVLVHGRDYTLSYRIRRKRGDYIHVQDTGKVFKNSLGQVERIIGGIVDMTEQKRAEEGLKQSRERLGGILASIADGYISLDDAWRFLAINPVAERDIFRRPAGELLGKAFWDIYPQGRGGEFHQHYEKAFRKRVPVHFEAKSNVTDKWLEVHAYPVDDRLDVYFRDITERKEKEEALRRETQILAQVHESIIATDLEGTVTLWNKGAERLFGYTAVEALGNPVSLIYFDEDRSVLHESVVAPVLAAGQHEIEVRTRHKSGREIYIHLSLSLLQDESGDPYGMIGFSLDVTPRRRAADEILKLNEAVVMRNRELETINRELDAFIYSVSHDLRAPLRPLRGFSDILLEDYSDSLDNQGRDYLARIRKASVKMGMLIDDLLALSRISQQELAREDIDLNRLAASVIAECREGEPGRDVRVDIAAGITAFADSGLMAIVLTNLLGNAWKFTAKKPEAHIEFGSFEQEAKRVYFIKDNGAGFNPEYKDKLFQPFHRLHGDNEFPGTGIGLTVVDRVIRRHGGKVWGEGTIGQGATFYFTLE